VVALFLFLACQVALPGLFTAPRLALFDLYERVAPRHRAPALEPVVIVAIDDASLRVFGPWPWPRALQARLIAGILRAAPAAVGVDALWSEGVRASDAEGGRQVGDQQLVEALGSGPTAIGVLGSQDPVIGGGAGTFAPMVYHGQTGPLADLVSFTGELRSVPAIDQAAAGHGLMSNDPDADGVFRHLRLLSTVAGSPAPDLSLEVYRLAARAPYLSLYTTPGGRGLRGIGVGPSTFPTARDGSLWIDYSRDPTPLVSAKDVLLGVAPRQAFDGQLVLVGLTGAGLVDQARKTPIGPMPGIEIRAQGLENLLAGALAGRPALVAEAALTFLAGLFLIIALPPARGAMRVAAALAPLLALGALGAILWSQHRVLTDVATPALGCGATIIALLGGGLAEVDAQRRRLRDELELRRLAAARAEGELEAGRRIQMGILPKPADLAADARFDLDAVMEPARQTGGDLYDFFKIGPDQLFIAVGDVSGKGLPAAIFMAIGKVLAESCALRGESDIGAIVREANAEISRNNRETLFITLFAGLLDLRTGELSFCNAGHDTPFLLRPDQPPAAVTGVGGPPLCVVEDFPYVTETIALNPGDLVCVATDGVTDATNVAGALFGREAAEKVLAATPPAAGASDVIARLRSAVSDFAAGAEPYDDLTILAVRWRGPAAT
jgi:serine phosphatase RsbU (regulator of sigma subunit)/CHASE2 domain-containing sensor protein